MNFTAKDLYEATKLGELISDKEITNIPADGISLIHTMDSNPILNRLRS